LSYITTGTLPDPAIWLIPSNFISSLADTGTSNSLSGLSVNVANYYSLPAAHAGCQKKNEYLVPVPAIALIA